MTVWTSAALYDELRKLIPELPTQCVNCTISLAVNDLARIELTTLGARDANGEHPKITQRFTLVPEVES
jgi:hypothetical protein